MDDQPGLRERKKQRTHDAISNAAIDLFLEHGFDAVSISQVAEAAEVSRRTLFAYFPAKEDLVLHRVADHGTESARVVRAYPAAPLTALRAHFLDGLARHDPIAGLCDLPEVLALYRLITSTPSLVAGMLRFRESAEHALAAELGDLPGVAPLTARLAAAQIASVQWRLSMENHDRVATGVPATTAYPGAVAAAEQAFDLLSHGLAPVLPQA
ncbi:TetR/AcrR family transcriptional regulator [Amycolatopsis sp. FDAARGOS 1241]|uniref:TetR/AcrR family transcriptional regulator n=1 Tax=Amycolatopsis sp. FDAARGOS 1241 TaxID=2778070 RepID=UPI0019503ACF|nr:TetR family transcriptional regulator [Amycolatopsis sp. FDAARGOS 1241]QRP46014.1 TetR family transcriptional regulator [Amycolatopsis sp. FDAARGOS 1241]